MSLFRIFDSPRQVIPRWHTYPMARWLGVTMAAEATPADPTPDENYREKIRSWEKSGKLLHAADLVGNALVLNCFDDEQTNEAAQFILKNEKGISGPLLEVTQSYLRLSKKEPFPLPEVIVPEESKRFFNVIAGLKRRTREYPRNPILWMDLAFYYSAIGQTRAAEHAVAVALSLNSENRYLLRSGARFYMHVDSPDKALHFLRRSSAGNLDPWLVAAEIAISDTIKLPSKKIKRAREIVEDRSLNNFHISELASALGTIEIRDGSRKKGKKLFAMALQDPTENSLAQATHFASELGELGNNISQKQLTHSFEAETSLKFYGEDFKGALEAAKKWFAYQPFSSRPAVTGSYIAAVTLGQFDESIKIAKMGQLSSPDDLMLRNNLAFSLASMNRTDEALEVLAKTDESESSDLEKDTLLATKALIEFRRGNTDNGRKLYERTVNSFKKSRDHRSESIAKFFWSREEALVKSPVATRLREDSLAEAMKLGIIELLAASKITEKDK